MENQATIPVEHVSLTAWMTAAFRYQESLRPDAHYDDRITAKLLDGREKEYLSRSKESEAIKAAIDRSSWLLVVRTYLIDQLIEKIVRDDQIDTVINLGAGLDTRPYRLTLPETLRWYEADYSSTVDYKNQKLQSDKPKCQLTRLAADLGNDHERAEVLATATADAKRTLILSEGLLAYLSTEAVTSLAKELFAATSVQSWVMDLIPPSFFKWIQQNWDMGSQPASRGETTLRFLPENPAEFFAPLGWKMVSFNSFGETAIELNRVPKDLSEEKMRTTEGLQASGIALFKADRPH